MTYLTVKEAMNYLNIKSNKTFKRLIVSGLPVINMGKSLRVKKDAIDEFMQAHTVVANTERKQKK